MKILVDPGFVPNTVDKMHCLQSCLLMALRGRPYAALPSIEELDSAIGTDPGLYSWPYAGLNYCLSLGLSAKLFERLNPLRLCQEGSAYMIEYFGEEIGSDQVRNTNVESVQRDAQTFLEKKNAVYVEQAPTNSDVIELLDDGYYVIAAVNQRVLQGDTGYIGHFIFIYGYSERGVIAHNPGPPPTIGSEISWYLFDRASNCPDASARCLIAVKP